MFLLLIYTINLTLSISHTNTNLPCAISSPGRGEVVTTCPGIITGADGNRLPHAVSSILSLIGKKLHVTL